MKADYLKIAEEFGNKIDDLEHYSMEMDYTELLSGLKARYDDMLRVPENASSKYYDTWMTNAKLIDDILKFKKFEFISINEQVRDFA